MEILISFFYIGLMLAMIPTILLDLFIIGICFVVGYLALVGAHFTPGEKLWSTVLLTMTVVWGSFVLWAAWSLMVMSYHHVAGS